MTKQRIPKWFKPREFPRYQTAVMSDHWVWCDEHAQLHEATEDLFQEGNERCNEENWRPVYVATDDGNEEF